jgi:hypothetical protein
VSLNVGFTWFFNTQYIYCEGELTQEKLTALRELPTEVDKNIFQVLHFVYLITWAHGFHSEKDFSG